MENNEFEQRRQTVASGLAEHKLDGLLVSFGPNLRYLSGFTGSNALLLMTPSRSILFTDPRYTIQAGQESTCQVHICERSAGARSGSGHHFRLRLRRVGYEPAMMSCDAFRSLDDKMPAKASLVAVTGWIEQLRMVKSASEIARIRQSVETNSRAFEQGVARVKPGMKEQDLAAELGIACAVWAPRSRRSRPSWPEASAPALPHAQPHRRALREGRIDPWWTWAHCRKATAAI